MSRDKNEYSDEEIRELLREVLKTEYENKKTYNKKVKINTALASTLKEFLTNFVVLGYDLSNSPVIIKYARTQMEKDALKSLSVRYISEFINEDD